MDKNKILSLYRDFAEGKLLSYNDRINFLDRFNKLTKQIKDNPPDFGFAPNSTNYSELDPNYFNGLIHHMFVLKLNLSYGKLSKENPKPIYEAIIPALNQITYYQAYNTRRFNVYMF